MLRHLSSNGNRWHYKRLCHSRSLAPERRRLSHITKVYLTISSLNSSTLQQNESESTIFSYISRSSSRGWRESKWHAVSKIYLSIFIPCFSHPVLLYSLRHFVWQKNYQLVCITLWWTPIGWVMIFPHNCNWQNVGVSLENLSDLVVVVQEIKATSSKLFYSLFPSFLSLSTKVLHCKSIGY